ncbi:MAG: transcriptional regulator [Microbacterium sp.]|jgi:LCP family protein required for cell wall assembly|nr:transcriptional regulator [Microbacterium sp.]
MRRGTSVIGARHAKSSPADAWKRLLAVLGISALVLVASSAGVGAFIVGQLDGQLAEEAFAAPDGVELPPDISALKGGFSMLLVGSDLCEPEIAGQFGARCEEDDGGERNDVTMLVHVSDAPRRATVISFPRDMIVPVPACPREDGSGEYPEMSGQPLNATMGYGGMPCTWLTIQELTGIPIQFAAKITWGGVIEMSNAIGGVDVCVAGDGIDDPDSGLMLEPGQHTLQGAQALAFLRVRYGIGDGSDLGRISNQQQFMTSLVRKVRSEGVLSDPAAMLRLAYAATDAVAPSESLRQPLTMVQLAMALKDIPFADIVFVQYPTFYDAANPNKVDPDTDSAAALVAAVMANQPLNVTGKPSGGNGVEVVETAPTADPSATATPTGTPEARVDLPENVTGTNADQQTCTVGLG